MTRRSKHRILVVDDDEVIRATLVDMLELNGFETVTAADGAAGLAVLKHESPSLVITDVAMPGLDGFGLLKTLREDPRFRTVPVIVISATEERAATRHGMDLGADDFITKPFSEQEVVRSITARLERKELLDELDAFAHTVAHDLRNPLSVVAGRLDVLLEMIDTGDADAGMLKEQAAEARFAVRRVSHIFDDLLVLAGVRRQSVVPQALDMGAIVREALDRVADLVRQRGATVTAPDVWPASVGHAPWVAQVWVNYISNAAKYGGEKPSIELGAMACPDGTRSVFWVADRGPGLDAAGREKMFVPFTRISTVRAQGHGLGLSIVRRIVEKLGGQVGVESEPRNGAKFWFELPQAALVERTE